jgi:hypothetical protein
VVRAEWVGRACLLALAQLALAVRGVVQAQLALAVRGVVQAQLALAVRGVPAQLALVVLERQVARADPEGRTSACARRIPPTRRASQH